MGYMARANLMHREPEIVSRCASLSRKRKPEVTLEGSHLGFLVLADELTRLARGPLFAIDSRPLT